MARTAIPQSLLVWPGHSDSGTGGPPVCKLEPQEPCSVPYRSGWAEGLVFVNSGGNLLAPRAIHLSLEAWDGFMDCVELAALDVIGREKLRQRHLHEQRLALQRLGPALPVKPAPIAQNQRQGGASNAQAWTTDEDGVEVEDQC